MKSIVFLICVIAFEAVALAQEYTPVDGVQILESDRGYLGIRIGRVTNFGCLIGGSIAFGDVDVVAITLRSSSGDYSKWQMRPDDSDSWADIPETTEIEEGRVSVCALAPPTLPGEYRWVWVGEADGVKGEYTSENILIVSQEGEVTSRPAEEPETTVVEAVSWGFIKVHGVP